ncbi:MAG TPA: hypothetical protein VIJ33_03340 [Solirubrobacteraceae bacterium]
MAPTEQVVISVVRSAASGVLGAATLPFRVLKQIRVIAGELELISSLTAAVEDLHLELTGLRSDLSTMPGDSKRLADGVEVVQEALGDLSAELVEVKASVAPVHDDLERIEEGLAPLPNGLDALLLSVGDLAGRLDGMRGELTGELDALRTDLSALPFVSKS